MSDKLFGLLLQLPCYVLFGWAACMFMVFAQRAILARDKYKDHFDRLAKERAALRVACRDCIDWFEQQIPMGEVYALGYLAFDDLRRVLANRKAP